MNPSLETSTHRRGLALASLKSGESLVQRCLERGEGNEVEAINLYREAVALLRPDALSGFAESRHLLAVALCQLSRARLILEKRGSANGLQEARESLVWLGDAELCSRETLRLSLTSRISEACHLESTSRDQDLFLDLTDIAEGALSVAAEGFRLWGTDAVDPALVGDLIRLGGDAYLIASPDFLAEFLLDWLDPERREPSLSAVTAANGAALAVLARGISWLRESGFTETSSKDGARNRERLAAWLRCQERLATIRDRCVAR